MFEILKEGTKVIYTGGFPYYLANGQRVQQEGEELLIRSNVQVQKGYFHLKLEEKKPIEKEPLKETNEKTLDEMDKVELIEFAESKNIEIDKRQGEKKIRQEINNALN